MSPVISPTPPWRAVCAAILTFLLSAALAGCASHDQVEATAVVPLPAAPAPTLQTLELSPLYQEAERDCHARQYRRAAACLKQLAATPGLTADLVAFCNQQEEICLQDAGVRAAPSKSVPVAALPRATPTAVSDADCGPRALALVCEQQDVKANVPELRVTAGTTSSGTSLAGLARAAHSVGFTPRGVQVDKAALDQLDTPAIAWVNGNHYIAVLAVDGDKVTVHDPNYPNEEKISADALIKESGGVLLTLSR